MLSPKQKVDTMIAEYVKTLGYQPEKVYDTDKKVWLWQQNNRQIQAYVESIHFKNGLTRDYLRIFSPLLSLPSTINEVIFFKFLLELNDSKLGIKITLMPETDWIYAAYERDIKGMDYVELATCLSDLAWWSSRLSAEIKEKIDSL